MNDKAKFSSELIEYQAEKLRDLLQATLRCCEEKRMYESTHFGLPHAELTCLQQFHGERYRTVKSLSAKLNVAKSRITKLISNLTGKGYVEQMNDPKDKRIKLINLTAKGEKILSDIDALYRNIHKQILLQMNAADRKNLLTNLHRLASAMETVKTKFL